MTDTAALARLIENLIRLGTIAEVDHGSLTNQRPADRLAALAHPACRQASRVGSRPPWARRSSSLAPAARPPRAFLFCVLFSQLLPANGDRAGLHRRTYPDGAVVEYDSVAHRLRAILPAGGVIDLTSLGGINIIGPLNHQGIDRQPKRDG